MVAVGQGADQIVTSGDQALRLVAGDRAECGETDGTGELLDTLTTPEPNPASAFGTSDIPICSRGMKEAPAPTPSIKKAKKIFGKYSACGPAEANRSSPPRQGPSPGTSPASPRSD